VLRVYQWEAISGMRRAASIRMNIKAAKSAHWSLKGKETILSSGCIR
jgi:hypothetical protein